MILNKWNYKNHNYEDYEVPDYWNVVLLSYDMEEIINCAHCGEELEYGQSYCSKEIHNSVGFGYAICESCLEEEWKRLRKCKGEL